MLAEDISSVTRDTSIIKKIPHQGLPKAGAALWERFAALSMQRGIGGLATKTPHI